jgi:hypothetical protein
MVLRELGLSPAMQAGLSLPEIPKPSQTIEVDGESLQEPKGEG